MKMRKGNPPEGAGWLRKSILVGSIKWDVYYRAAGAGVSWTEVKLAAETPAPYKGNFYMKWNGERFANSRDSEILVSQHGELHRAAIKLLTGIDSEVFLAGAKKREVPPSGQGGIATGMEMLSEHNPELYAKLIEALEAIQEGEPRKAKTTEEPGVTWVNLGPVGEVVNLERDLLVREISDKDLEIRLSTSDPDTPTDSFCNARKEGSSVVFGGPLYAALNRNTPELWSKVEELVRQYFTERDFY